MSKTIVDKIKSAEIGRFQKSLEKAISEIRDEKYEIVDIEKFDELEERLALLEPLLIKAFEVWTEKFFVLGRPADNEQSEADRRISGFRYLFQKFPKSYLFKAALPLLGMADIQEELMSYSVEVVNSLHNMQKCSYEIEDYFKHLEEGEKLEKMHKGSADCSCQADDQCDCASKKSNLKLVKQYATLKKWGTETDFNNFNNVFSQTVSQMVEVYVDGPLKLYLIISENKFMIVIKAFTFDSLFNLKNSDEKSIDDLKHTHLATFNMIKDSKTLSLMVELMRKVAPIYAKNWKADHSKLRDELIDDDRRIRFVERFENGQLFKKV